MSGSTRSRIMLIAGEFWAGSSGSGLAKGFRDLGWAVQQVDYRYFCGKTGHNILARGVARLIRGTTDSLYRSKIIEQCRILKPDVFLTIKGVTITSDLLSEIRRCGTRAVMYYPDFHFDHPGVFIDSFDKYDLFVTTKTFQMQYLRALLGKARTAYVPHGYDSSVHSPVFEKLGEEDYNCDLLYAGNHSPYKQEWMRSVTASLPDLTLHLVGNRWRDEMAMAQSAGGVALGERIGIAYAEAIQLARVNIALHFGPTASGWEDRVSTRTFEVPACRGFMLHVDNEEVREFFEPGTEIDVFSTPAELRDKICFYLPRSDLRKRMIERAYSRCVPHYSYGARAKLLHDLIVK